MLKKNIETFLGCDREYDEAKIVLFGAPFDSTTSYRPGTRFASRTMRAESYGLETFSPYLDLDLEDAYVSQHVALIRLMYKAINTYIHTWLIGEHGGRKLLLDISYGAKPGLNLKNINDLLIPFAPHKQQEKILKRVNELMSLCDNLNMVLQSTRQTQLHLADALTDAALN